MNTFYMPTRVFEDDDCVWNKRMELSKLGKKTLIVTGKNSSKINGSLSDVEKALTDISCEWVIYDKVEENPSVETVVEAATIGLNEAVDYIIAIGGGSPMDAAKAIALLIYNKTTDGDYLYDSSKSSLALPVVAIPTTCGTGSEVTGVSVLTVHGKKTKCSLPHKIFPCMALVDSKYLQFASDKIIRDTAVDALSHLWESYINTMANDYSKMIACEGLKVWSEIKDALINCTYSKEDYKNLMHAATLAGMAIAHAGTTIPHSLSYSVTYEIGTSHGKAVGMFLSGYLEKTPEDMRKLMLNLAGFDSVSEFDDFFETVCGRDEISDELKTRIVEEVYARKAKLEMVPFTVDKKILEEIAGYGN